MVPARMKCFCPPPPRRRSINGLGTGDSLSTWSKIRRPRMTSGFSPWALMGSRPGSRYHLRTRSSTKSRGSFRRTTTGWHTPRTSPDSARCTCNPSPPPITNRGFRPRAACSRAGGKELFYVTPDGKLAAVAVTVTPGPKPSLKAGAPVEFFDAHISSQNQNFFNYDVTADGKRFLVDTSPSTASSSGPSVPPLTVRINWNATSEPRQ
jgi:hypothetical protein